MELRVDEPISRGDELLFHGTTNGMMLSPPHGRSLIWFAEHQVSLGYTAAMIEQAAADGAEIIRAVCAEEAPYDGVAAAAWLARTTYGGGTTSDG